MTTMPIPPDIHREMLEDAVKRAKFAYDMSSTAMGPRRRAELDAAKLALMEFEKTHGLMVAS